MIVLIIGIFISFLIGSIPFGYVIGRFFKKIDLRKYGSGNIGATNTLRVLGKASGIVVLFFDILKGFIAVTIILNCCYHESIPIEKSIFIYLLGIATIIGHDWSIFLRFKGGKGVSTTLGVLLGISLTMPEVKLVILFLVIIWVLVVLLTKFVSLGSILTAVAIPVIFLFFKMSLEAILFGLVCCLLIIIRHKDNIKRLFNKEEKRLSL